MRRESSTVVALVGDLGNGLLAALGTSPGISVARGPRAEEPPAAGEQRPAWEPGALALREAAHRPGMYVLVPEDPLAGVAAGWRAMWDLSAGPGGAAGFEQQAAEALAAWRGQRFELPDYYLVVTPAPTSAAGPDLYLGPLRAVRPRRVAVAGVTDGPGQAARLVDTLTSLEHGPWWPPLDELLDAARRFNAGGLAATRPAPAPDR
jgi:hypothetical protein